MGKIISVSLPQDLPENWNENQYVSPGGIETGLTEQHGYNYLMRQVNNTQKAAQELDNWSSSPHTNLLHNWDFRNPVDQKRVYIVVPGTSYYRDAALSTKVGDVADYYRAVQMNDTYGTIVINGVTYYVNWASAVRGNFNHPVGIDRWSINPGSRGSALFVQSGGVLARLSPVHGRLSQSVTTPTLVPPSIFAGKVVTASVKVESVSTGGCHLYVNDGVTQFGIRIPSAGTFKVTGTISAAPTGVGVVVQNTSETDYCDIKISAIKLELGEVSTLEGDPPADYAQQMAICSQYHSTTGVYLGAVPYGYIETSITVSSAQELDTKLDQILAGMTVTKMKFIVVDFGVQHPVLGGGTRIFRIDKIWDEYCVIQAVGYREESLGAVSEFFRSKFNGTWTSWVRTYNTAFKPTPTEIGAAPAGFGLGETAVNTANVDVNLLTRTGFYGCNVNTPDGAWWYGIHVQYAPGYAWQQFSKTNDTVTVERKCYNGEWTPWKSLSTGTVIPATLE